MTGPVPRTTPRSAQERQIRSNWAQQAHYMWPAEDTYAREVLQRFRVSLTTRLDSDAELLSAEEADVLLRSRRLLEFYDHSETRIRATAQVVFAGVVDSHRAHQELIELLSSVRDRWWLRLSPEDVDAHNESFMDPQAWMAANGMTNGMSSDLLVPALRLPALPDAAAPLPASQQDARVPLPASGDDCDVSMDLTAELAGIIDVLEEEARPRAQALLLGHTFEERAEHHFGSQLVEYERNMAERTRQEVEANRAEVTTALEAVAANNAQLVAWGNVAFEQR